MNESFRRSTKLFFLAIFFVALVINSAFSDEQAQTKEVKAEELLVQADLFFQKGEYKKSIDSYLEAASVAIKRINLSRAYFGLSLSYFYLRDITNTKKWMRKVLEIDPEKQISVLFHPENFVQLFNQVQKEMKQGQEGEKRKELSSPKEAREEKPEKQKKQSNETSSASQKTEPSAPAPSKKKSFILGEEWAGKWEIEVHYSDWGLNLVKGLFEGTATKELGEEIRTELSNQVRDLHPGLLRSSYEQNLAFDSEGSNYGFEMRYYPLGREGFFSLGLSFEKTTIRLSVSGLTKQVFHDGSYATVDSKIYLKTSPFSTNLSFRWDFKPSWRVTPYFVFGFGLASLKGEVGLNYSGKYQWGGASEGVEKDEIKTLIQAEEDGDFSIPDIFFILQAAFGLRGEIYKGICLRVETGFWDGLLLRGGLAYRF
jgi:tetratricopeptide (TPR) repeat protein